MIFGIGTDIIEINRIRQAVERKNFKERVYTENERDYCQNRGKQAAASFAARFAGKEAFFKALGTGIFTDLTDVEILNDSAGKPEIFLHGKALEFFRRSNLDKIFLSLSHSKDYATAVCVLKRKES